MYIGIQLYIFKTFYYQSIYLFLFFVRYEYIIYFRKVNRPKICENFYFTIYYGLILN